LLIVALFVKLNSHLNSTLRM